VFYLVLFRDGDVVFFILVGCNGGRFSLDLWHTVSGLDGHAGDEISLVQDLGFLHRYSGLTVLFSNRRL
jgi:hypothetical protein